MRRRVPALTVSLLLLAVPLAACGSDELSPEAQWADGVCSARAEVSDSVDALKDALTFDASAGLAGLPDAKTQIADAAQSLEQSVADLRTAIDDQPDGVDTEVADAKSALTQSADAVRDSIDTAKQAVSQVGSAGGVQEFVAALGAAATTLAGAGEAVTALADQLRSYRDSASSTVKQAFEDAPACR
jgi:uncharacterized phage infection (PIP) family protein YhgE